MIRRPKRESKFQTINSTILSTSRQFHQTKFFFTKNLMKTFKLQDEIDKEIVNAEREETFKKMTNYFLKSYATDKSFKSNMIYYQKKMGIKEPIQIDNRQLPSTKKKNEEILFYRKLRNAPSAAGQVKYKRFSSPMIINTGSVEHTGMLSSMSHSQIKINLASNKSFSIPRLSMINTDSFLNSNAGVTGKRERFKSMIFPNNNPLSEMLRDKNILVKHNTFSVKQDSSIKKKKIKFSLNLKEEEKIIKTNSIISVLDSPSEKMKRESIASQISAIKLDDGFGLTKKKSSIMKHSVNFEKSDATKIIRNRRSSV